MGKKKNPPPQPQHPKSGTCRTWAGFKGLCCASEALRALGTCWRSLVTGAASAKHRFRPVKRSFACRVLSPKGKERFQGVFHAAAGSVQSWEFIFFQPDPKMSLESASIFTQSWQGSPSSWSPFEVLKCQFFFLPSLLFSVHPCLPFMRGKPALWCDSAHLLQRGLCEWWQQKSDKNQAKPIRIFEIVT